MNVPRFRPSPAARKSRMAADDRHRQLLRSAIDCVARNGFGGTKTKDIAAAAGVSEAILFRHFATKEDLYHAILDMKEGQADGKGEALDAADWRNARRAGTMRACSAPLRARSLLRFAKIPLFTA